MQLDPFGRPRKWFSGPGGSGNQGPSGRMYMGVVLKPTEQNLVAGFFLLIVGSPKPASRKVRARRAQGFAHGLLVTRISTKTVVVTLCFVE